MANIRKRGNSYQIRVSAGYNSYGQQIVKTKTWKPDKSMTSRQAEKEATRQALIFEEQCQKGFAPVNMSFEAFAEMWFEDYAKPNLRKTTVQQMKTLKARVYPVFGHMKLDKITRRQVQFFIDELAKNGKSFTTGNLLSRKSLTHHLNFLSDIFGYAVRLDMIADNPCRNVIIPKREASEKAVYTVDEIRKIIDILGDSPAQYRAFFLLAIYGGFRRSEILGLEWKDVDFRNNIVSIRRTSNYTVDNGTFTDTTKTKKSARSLRLPSAVFDALIFLKEEQDKSKSLREGAWFDSDRLFVGFDGRPMGTNTPYNWLKRVCSKNSIRFCGIHAMRHFNASVLIFAGIDPATVSSALGHSAVSTTVNIYSHAFQESQAKAGTAIADILGSFDISTSG